MYLEKWKEMSARHERERLELVQSLAPYYTVYQAAKILNINDAVLRSYAFRNDIQFLRKIGREASLVPPQDRLTASLNAASAGLKK